MKNHPQTLVAATQPTAPTELDPTRGLTPVTANTAASALAGTARDLTDRIRYMVLGTIDEDGRTRTSPVYFVPHRYRDLYWVSSPTSHHSHNLQRDDRLSAVIFDSTVPPGPDQQAVYVAGTAREIPSASLTEHLPKAFRPERGARAFTEEELSGAADLRLWVLRVDRWEVHIGGSHPVLGSGTDRRASVDPTG